MHLFLQRKIENIFKVLYTGIVRASKRAEHSIQKRKKAKRSLVVKTKVGVQAQREKFGFRPRECGGLITLHIKLFFASAWFYFWREAFIRCFFS